MSAVAKKLHHFVPRFYLDAWAVDDKVCCLQSGRVFQPNVRNVGAENHFYRLRELQPSDVAFIHETVINDSPERLKSMHLQLLQQFMTPHAAKAHYQKESSSHSGILAAIDKDIAEANENFHAKIEQSFQPYLESLRGGDLRFLSNDNDGVAFYRGLAVQYTRTNHRRRIEMLMPIEERSRFERTANIISHMLALNLGYSLFNAHPRMSILLIENETDVPFLTSDQPMINIAAKFNDHEAPVAFEGYYPVSPWRALLILEAGSEFYPRNASVTAMEAHLWNLRIASRAYRQVFSCSREQLETVRADLPVFVDSL
ncbi:hypothetical protein HNQ77_002289 [Silvibacterium bohemicum]|uniref:DUF4238 domain-containing protein n=1 Tax=Silvibacterium bohemicum TaxID=1577686 RepID=A0A841JV42_9BACT|nr:DUF4238 domain-containing protein [Silvibacterium bohemicum]MBB6144337.1 hypothetical protein [Silvibacterium bohemicum]